jgi:hypothetical protein
MVTQAVRLPHTKQLPVSYFCKPPIDMREVERVFHLVLQKRSDLAGEAIPQHHYLVLRQGHGRRIEG